MKKTFTIREKTEGQLAARAMNEKALRAYNDSEIEIYAVDRWSDDEEPEKIREFYLNIDGTISNAMTFEEVEETFERLQEDADAMICEEGPEIYGPSILLQSRRRMAGLTQRQLADRTGISIRTIQAYEQGQKDLGQAAARTVLTIVKALGCRIEDLIDQD